MKRPAVFFDRDNTLMVSDGYLGDASQVELVDGAAPAVARARRLGFVVATISNQSGVAKGLFDEPAVHAVNARLDEMLSDEEPDAVIDRHEFCPFHPEATVERYKQDSDLRKPKPGMILRCAEQLDLDLTQSWVIGDAPRDVDAGKAAGCRTILLRNPKLSPSPAAEESGEAQADHTVMSLKEAMDVIERHTPAAATTGATPSPPPAVTPDASPSFSTARLERIGEQILQELRRTKEQPTSDFSVSKLLAGIVQVLAVATLFMAYLNRASSALDSILLLAIAFQTLTIALLIMGRQK